tara:strand:+ start:50195 stop:51415 length:1221 start_codon:yes stop_codon:yes gene_type:complete
MAQGPLDGIRVLELGSTVAGPFCARLLADFGAEVVKIEVPEGDPVRTFGKRHNGKSLYASSIFRNKRMASIDLRDKRGRELIKTLVPRFDILIENFKPGTMERWGLGYEDLNEINPGLIMVRISGFGQTGPYSHKPGYGVVCEAVSGMRHITGDPDRPAARIAVSLTDEITGTYAAYGVALAVLHKRATGKGQCIDAALYECAFSYMEPYVPAFDKTGFVPIRQGGRLPNSTPNNHYPTKDGRYIHIAAGNMPTWRRLATVMGRADLLEDTRLPDQVSLNENEDEIDKIVGTWTQNYSIEDLEQLLDEAGVPAARIYTMEDVFKDPHYADRKMIVEVPDDDLGSVKLANIVPRLSETPGQIRKAGGQPGVDTRSVLREFTKLSLDEIIALEADGVVFSGDGSKGTD